MAYVSFQNNYDLNGKPFGEGISGVGCMYEISQYMWGATGEICMQTVVMYKFTDVHK